MFENTHVAPCPFCGNTPDLEAESTSFAIRDGIVSLYDYAARLRVERDDAKAEVK